MRKISLIFAVVILLAGVPASAQKKRKPITLPGPPPVVMPNITIQDEAGGGYFILNPSTGEYKCNFCEYNFGVSGVGSVKIEGCAISFSELRDGYRMVASVNICGQQGKVAIEMDSMPDGSSPYMPMREYWTDLDLRNNTSECPEVKPLPVPPLPGLPVELQIITLQDDNGGGFITFNTSTGEYKCYFCKYGQVLYGFGEVKTDGCNLYFSDLKNGYRLFASMSVCDHQGKAAIEVDTMPDGSAGSIYEYWTDLNMIDSPPDCKTPVLKQ